MYFFFLIFLKQECKLIHFYDHRYKVSILKLILLMHTNVANSLAHPSKFCCNYNLNSKHCIELLIPVQIYSILFRMVHNISRHFSFLGMMHEQCKLEEVRSDFNFGM